MTTSPPRSIPPSVCWSARHDRQAVGWGACCVRRAVGWGAHRDRRPAVCRERAVTAADLTAKLHLPAGSTADGPWTLVITPETAGWGYSALRVLELTAGGQHSFGPGEFECVVLPLSGGCTVECDGSAFELAGRRSVFSRVTDFAYAPRDSRVTVRSARGGRFALPSARCRRRLAARYGAA